MCFVFSFEQKDVKNRFSNVYYPIAYNRDTTKCIEKMHMTTLASRSQERANCREFFETPETF